MYGNNQWDIGTLILKLWLLNSVGSECHPYKVEVVGSNPTEATLTNPCGKQGQLTIICKIVVMGI